MAPLYKAVAAIAAVTTRVPAFVSTPGPARPTSPAPRTSAASHEQHDAAWRARRRSRPRPSLPAPLQSSATYELDEKELRGPLTPIEDTVLVKVAEAKKVTTGGVFLPTVKKERITRGTVVSVGEGKRHWDTGVQMPITVKPGERVVYGNFEGTEVEYQGSPHLLMRDTDVLMAYEGDEINLDTARMVGDRALLRVKIQPKGTTTSSAGVLIAESATRSSKPTVGVVVKVGPGRMSPSGSMMPMYCEVGDNVKYKDFAAEVVTIEGLETDEYELVCIRNVDVLAKW